MRSVLQKLALAALSVTIMLAIVEVLLRTFAPLYTVGNIYWYQYDEALGIRLKPDMHSFSTTDYQAEMRTNALGTINFQEDFGDYDELVFAIGDSYTQGTGLASDAAYPFQLDLMLNMVDGRYEKRFAVINLGLAAYGAEQAMLALERYADEIGKPDYVLFFGCSNDYSDDQLFESGYRHGHLVSGNPRYGVLLGPIQWLTNEVEVMKRLKYAVAKLRQGPERGRSAPDESKVGSEKAKQSPPNVAELQEHRLDRMAELTSKYDAELVVSWTDLEGNDHGDYEWLRAWAERRGARFADWRPAVASVVAAIPVVPTVNSHSGGHRRTWVNQMIAEAYAAQISGSGLERSVTE